MWKSGDAPPLVEHGRRKITPSANSMTNVILSVTALKMGSAQDAVVICGVSNSISLYHTLVIIIIRISVFVKHHKVVILEALAV